MLIGFVLGQKGVDRRGGRTPGDTLRFYTESMVFFENDEAGGKTLSSTSQEDPAVP